ncbi:hypothetical protein TTHERM_00637470 (macronuclear) [Tetrahymena thermophila SB210]|uniref:Uncharacterized protein n=1 Tax=Tetrahymena thermophila (strain SB210) TaxID=312017 RepID=Q22HF6_TETTS|nr:hypothetical protein TTHERM_00637470 [Tetrahymena thermophila SB210]EAR84745.2 hypothetical protein TTHERM_00637470 [Tetrahymena thermophila SB210]|eukprot:XP_001032408.2 hypothetical protein TTHERM_00637470 [Tetrahymena thermophila SB210]
MKVSSYDSYTEEYNKAKKQYNYQTEGDEDDEEEDKEQLVSHNLNKDHYGNHEMYESYGNNVDYESQDSNQESEGILDYIYKRQMTQGQEEDFQEENIKYLEEEEKQMIDSGLQQQKQQFKQTEQIFVNKKNQENLPHQNFDDIKHKMNQKISQAPQKFQKQNYEESEIPQGAILKTVQNNRTNNKKQIQQIEQITKQICQFCDWNISRIKFLRENLHIRYFEAFNFYFAKPINEILANYALPHVITLKDYTYFYDENEYLKRYYRVEEVPPRLAVLTNFFTNSYKQTRPNLIVTNQYKVIQKRNVKQARLFMRQVAKNVNNGIGYNVNNNIYNKDDSSDSEGYSSEKNNDSNQAGANSKGSKKKTNLPSKVLYSHLSQSMGLSQNQSNQSEEQSNSQNYQEYDNYRNFIMQMSFETSTHDIYYPSFSNSKMNIENAQSKNKIVQESQQKYKSIRLSQESNSQNQNKIFNQEDEERQVQITDFNSNLQKDKKHDDQNEFQGENEQNPRLLELIVGDDKSVQFEKQEIQNTQQIKLQKSNIQNINQIIEQMQMQGIQNYHNLLDIDQEALTQNINIRDQYLNKNSNNNYDPSKRISTLISQSSATQPSQLNAFNTNNYIIGTNWQNLPANPQLQSTQKQFDKLNLQELHLGSNVVYVNSINTEGRSSEPSIQPTFRDGFMLLNNPHYQNEIYRNSNSQLPLNIQDLQSNTFPFQQTQLLGQSIEDYNKTDPQRIKQNDSNKKQNSQQKSVQQVQQYILSQIKKQHDFLNMGRNQQATLSTQNSQHPFYTSLSPDIKDKKEISSSNQKQLKPSKVNHAYTNEFNEGKAKQYNSGKPVQNSSRKLLTERNFTEINLGSIFEKLKLSNRLASLENKQTQINQSHNQENFIQKITNSSQSRNNSTKKKNSKQSEVYANKPLSNDISPIGYTPRNFKKKNFNSKEDPSLKYIHSEQSPELSKKLSHINSLIAKTQVGDKKNSVSQNHLNNNNNNNNSSLKKHNNSSKVRDQTSFEVLSGRVSVSPAQNPYKNQLQGKTSSSQAHQLTTTLDHSQQVNNSVINQLIKDSINTKSSNNITTRISNISNLRNKIISAGEQKSSMNSPSRICTDRDTQNPRLKQSKSPSLNSHGVISKISQKKAQYKRSSNNKLNGQNSHLYQKQNTNNVVHSNYYQRGDEQTNYTQINPNNSMNNITTNCNSISQNQILPQTQQQENSSCNLQLQLLQQIKQNLAAASNTNNNSGAHIPSHHGSVPQVQQSHFGINGNSQLVSHHGNSPSHPNQKSSNKTLSQKILTNALTNTINKFYKNALKNGETEQIKDNAAQVNMQQNQKSSLANQQNRNNQSPQQNLQNPQFFQNSSQAAQYTVESDQSPRLVQQSIQNYQKQNVKKQQNSGQTRIQTKIKGIQSDDISQKFIKSLCKQRVKQKDSIGSQNQISANLETLNSARNSSIIKVQDYKVNNQNGNIPVYGAIGSQQQQMQINAADSKKKQLQMRQKGSNGIQNNAITTSLNGMVSNQSINSSVNNINSIIGSSNYINNLTSNNTAQTNANANQSQKINNQKSQNPSNFNSKNSNHPTNLQNQNYNLILNPSIINGQTNVNGISSNPSLNAFQQQNQHLTNSQVLQQLQTLNQQYANLDSNYNSNNQANHQRIESIKKVNSPRQSQPLIKPPQNINQQLSNSSLINHIQKQSDQRIFKTEAPYQSEDSQIQIMNSYKNLLNQNSQNINNQIQQNSKQQQQQQQQLNLEILSSPPSNNNQQIPYNQTSKNDQLKIKNQIGVTLSPDRIKEQKKKIIQNNDDNKNHFNSQINGQFQLQTQLAQAKKIQDEFQLGNGFYTQRNNGKNRKKSNEHLGSNQKFIQSSRGSYQGHYADLSAWKHNSISKQGSENQQNPVNTISQQESNQQSKLLNTSPNRPIQQQQLNQQHEIYNQHYQVSNGNGNSGPLMQQQTATLLNQKIKQLSQKFQIQ